MKYKKSIISAILALLAVFTLLASGCGNTGTTGSNETAAENPSNETTAAEPTVDEYGREIVKSSLPDDLNYNGANVNLIIRETPEFYIDFYAESLNGEIVNDSIYERNVFVQEKLNVNFNMSFAPATNTSNTEAVGDAVRKSTLAGDSSYDIIGVYAYYGGATLAIDGMLHNIRDSKYIDFTKPWWSSEFIDTMTLYDQLYYIVGDINLTATDRLMVIYFNKKLMENHYGSSEVIYDEVDGGTWTIDKFAEYLKGKYIDINGDGAADENDFYGMSFINDSIGLDAWVPALGISLVKKDTSGEPQLTLYSERNVTVFNKLYSLARENPDVYFPPAKGYDNVMPFSNGQALFLSSILNRTTLLRDMEDGYGIVPYPKYDEKQDKYRTNAHDEYNLIAIPIISSDYDMASAVLELMCSETYSSVTPAYFEVAVKVKYLADNRAAQMFDIIRDGASYNFGDIYSLTISGGSYNYDTEYHAMIRNMIRSADNGFASRYAKNEAIYQAGLKVLTDKFNEMR